MQKVKDDIFLKNVGDTIRSLRKERGMSQLELGVKMDNYAEHIGRIERGNYNVKICTLKLIAESLNITLSELFQQIEGRSK